MGKGLQRVAAQCGGLVVKAKGVTTKYDANGKVRSRTANGCSLKRRGYAALSRAQMVLEKKHGTPAVFASEVYQAVPDFISMDEAKSAIEKYNREWNAAA